MLDARMDRDNSTGRQWRDQGHIALAETGASKEPAEERPRFIGDTDDFVRCLTIELEVELGLGSIRPRCRLASAVRLTPGDR